MGTNKRNNFIDLFIDTSRDIFKVRKPSGIKIFRLVPADFPKAKICQKNGPKYWRGLKESIKSQKSNKYYPIPPKKIKIIYIPSSKKIPTMPPKPRGRPPKKCRNITGLQNSSSSSIVLPVISFSQGSHRGRRCTDRKIPLPVRNKKDEVSSEAGESGEETDEEDLQRANGMNHELDDQNFAERLAEMAISSG